MKNIDYNRNILKGIELKKTTNELQAAKAHLHSELSIGFISSGSSTVTSKKSKLRFHGGDGLLIPPYYTHMCIPDDADNWLVAMMYIDDEIFEDKGFDFGVMRKLTQKELSDFKAILNLIEDNNLGFELENSITDLVISLACFDDSKGIKDEDDAVLSVYNYIKKNFLKNISLEELQADFFLNKYSLIRNFKLRYNTTPSAFQLQLKTDYSKKLLAQGLSLSYVCNAAGFYDQAHFSKEFKKSHSVTPAEYQSHINI